MVSRPASVWIWLIAFVAFKLWGVWPHLVGQAPAFSGRDWAGFAEFLLLGWGFFAMRKWAFCLLALDTLLLARRFLDNFDALVMLVAFVGFCAVCTLPHWRLMTWRFP